ncbi:MAG: hypothetical protein DI528_16605 [Shinella sp.]|nr:MAG: hypothetical protein DI528_16605 [Shinella sp.]
MYWQGRRNGIRKVGLARPFCFSGLIRAPDDGARMSLKRAAIFQIRSARFTPLFYRMSLPQNRCTLLRDML